MKDSLREFLKRTGLSDEAVDKISRGEVPDDDGVRPLRKGVDNPILEKFNECDRLLKEIQERLDKIEKADAHRRSFARGVASN